MKYKITVAFYRKHLHINDFVDVSVFDKPVTSLHLYVSGPPSWIDLLVDRSSLTESGPGIVDTFAVCSWRLGHITKICNSFFIIVYFLCQIKKSDLCFISLFLPMSLFFSRSLSLSLSLSISLFLSLCLPVCFPPSIWLTHIDAILLSLPSRWTFENTQITDKEEVPLYVPCQMSLRYYLLQITVSRSMNFQADTELLSNPGFESSLDPWECRGCTGVQYTTDCYGGASCMLAQERYCGSVSWP